MLRARRRDGRGWWLAVTAVTAVVTGASTGVATAVAVPDEAFAVVETRVAAGYLGPGSLPAAVRRSVAGKPKVLLVGDSTLAAVAWYPASQAGLGGLDYRLDAESCRAVTGPSCRGRVDPRTGRRIKPANVVDTLRAYPIGAFDELVVMAGYDESYGFFQRSLTALPALARERGVKHITWLSFRADVAYVPPKEFAPDASYAAYNALLRNVAASSGGLVTMLDWNRFVNERTGLVERDGVHLTPSGALAVAELVRAALVVQWGDRIASGSTGTSGGSGPGLGAPSGVIVPRTDLPTIAYASRGPAVVMAQRLLLQIGAPELVGVGATGRFFSATDAAVRRIQARVRDTRDPSMVVDGIIGPITWAWLHRLTGG